MSIHPVVHVEISATNLEAASKFYADLFGWKVEQNPELNYASFEPGEGVGGGFNPVQEGNPAGSVVVYIGTDDIEASLAKAETLGGKAIVPKTEIPGFGWFGMFLDPTGNKMGLYTAMAERS
ncbi:MAG TPA: VOC family protein [Anaerolineales bacterium]|nr:VOC family protein [Anaerolineales bacterium]